jgi:hypothetical protein
MKLWSRIGERRRQRAHERFLEERDRQRGLQGQDVEQAMRRVALRSNGNMQGGSFQ